MIEKGVMPAKTKTLFSLYKYNPVSFQNLTMPAICHGFNSSNFFIKLHLDQGAHHKHVQSIFW